MTITTKAGKFFLPAFIHAVLLFTALQAAKAQCPAGSFNNTVFSQVLLHLRSLVFHLKIQPMLHGAATIIYLM
jgi:hypothetical protein